MSDDAFEVEADFAFIGRTFEEYLRMFALEPDRLSGGRILDCPGGPSGFAAVAGRLGAEVTAVDRAYGAPADALADRCERAVRRTATQLREKRDRFVWTEYGTVETRMRYLRAAAQRFLADYGHRPGRYVAAALPDLPFADDSFDVALSGNLLFLYDDRIDLATHVAALRELARVATEVRVFPLAALDFERSELVAPVRERLAAAGHATTERSVPYEFQPGATEMLVVR